jgi:hypothetical protein
MPSKPRRTLAVITAAAALTAAVGLSAAPAGARVVARNAKFCAVVSDQGVGIDFEGLGPDEARFAAKLMRKAAKAGVPSKLKKDLNKLAKVYDVIAGGESAAQVVAAQQTFIVKALTRFSKYVAANCIATAPST